MPDDENAMNMNRREYIQITAAALTLALMIVILCVVVARRGADGAVSSIFAFGVEQYVPNPIPMSRELLDLVAKDPEIAEVIREQESLVMPG